MKRQQEEAAERDGVEDDDESDEEDETGWSPRLRTQEGYTPLMATLYSVLDAVNEIPRTLIAVNGKKPPPKQKLPRPFSALDLLELADERDEMHDLSRRFGLRKPR